MLFHSLEFAVFFAALLALLGVTPRAARVQVLLGASLLFGFIWTRVSPSAAFFTGAGFALVATALLYLLFSSGNRTLNPNPEP